MSQPPAVYKVAEVAALLAMGRRQTYEAIVRGDIPACKKIGGSVRCSKVAVHAWLDGETAKKEGGESNEDSADRGAAVSGDSAGNVRRACGTRLQMLEVGRT